VRTASLAVAIGARAPAAAETPRLTPTPFGGVTLLHRLAAATADAARAAAAAAAHHAATTMQSRVEAVLPEVIASDPELLVLVIDAGDAALSLIDTVFLTRALAAAAEVRGRACQGLHSYFFCLLVILRSSFFCLLFLLFA
jgi:hypothetical protein